MEPRKEPETLQKEKPRATISLKANLTPDFSTWRTNAFALTERPSTPDWFRETLLYLFLGFSVPLPVRQAFQFRFLSKRLPGWPERVSLRDKEDRWGCHQHLPVVYEGVSKEAEEEMKEALKDMIDRMAKVGVFDKMTDL